MLTASAFPRATPNRRPGLQYLATFAEMRHSAPVWRDPASGAWNLFCYADIATVLHDHPTYSSARDVGFDMPGNIVNLDPPRHDQLRAIVSQVFTPRAIAQLEPRIRAIADELLEATNASTEIEFVDAFAYPLPVIVIAEMLGVPAEDRPRFRAWTDRIHDLTDVDLASGEARAEAVGVFLQFQEYLRAHVQARRERPRQDLLTGLVQAELDGKRLSEDEIVGFATILLIAGHVTTTSALSNAVLCLDEYPEADAALRADPALLPTAIEEVLRFRSPVGRSERVATRAVELHGQHVAPGEELHVWHPSANHDESVFADAAAFVVDRQPNRHLAFGGGIHFCLGAPLARLELRCALELLLQRFARMRVDPDRPPLAYPSPLLNGVEKLYLRLERA